MVTRNVPDGESPPVSPLPDGAYGPGFGWLDNASAARPAEQPPGGAVLLFSGGIDSLCAWHLLGKPQAIYFATGAPWEDDELDALERLAREVHGLSWRLDVRRDTQDISFGVDNDGHIPYRNLWLVMQAVSRGWNTVYLGALRGETSRDKSTRFAKDTSNLLSYLEQRSVSVVLPFRSDTKAQLVRRYIDMVGRTEAKRTLALTQSCYWIGHEMDRQTGLAGCGMCLACVRRWVAMTANNIREVYYHDPTLAAMEMFEGATALEAVKHYGTRIRNPRELVGVLKNQWDLWRAVNRG